MAGFVTCSHAFLFSLVNPRGLSTRKMSLITGREQCGIYLEATVDQSLAVGTTYTYQIMQIQTCPVLVDSAAPISADQVSRKRSWLVMSTSLSQITRYLDSDSNDDKPTKKMVRIIAIKTDAVIDRMANSESNKLMQNVFFLYPGMNV